MMFQKLAEDGMQEQLSEAEIRALAIETLAENGVIEPVEDQEKIAAEVAAEYDFAGRIMAHACADELEKIAGAKELYRRGVDAAKGGYKSGVEYLKRVAGNRGKAQAVKDKMTVVQGKGKKAKPFLSGTPGQHQELKNLSADARAARIQALKAAGGTAAVAGAGYGMYRLGKGSKK